MFTVLGYELSYRTRLGGGSGVGVSLEADSTIHIIDAQNTEDEFGQELSKPAILNQV